MRVSGEIWSRLAFLACEKCEFPAKFGRVSHFSHARNASFRRNLVASRISRMREMRVFGEICSHLAFLACEKCEFSAKFARISHFSHARNASFRRNLLASRISRMREMRVFGEICSHLAFL